MEQVGKADPFHELRTHAVGNTVHGGVGLRINY